MLSDTPLGSKHPSQIDVSLNSTISGQVEFFLKIRIRLDLNLFATERKAGHGIVDENFQAAGQAEIGNDSVIEQNGGFVEGYSAQIFPGLMVRVFGAAKKPSGIKSHGARAAHEQFGDGSKTGAHDGAFAEEWDIQSRFQAEAFGNTLLHKHVK